MARGGLGAGAGLGRQFWALVDTQCCCNGVLKTDWGEDEVGSSPDALRPWLLLVTVASRRCKLTPQCVGRHAAGACPIAFIYTRLQHAPTLDTGGPAPGSRRVGGGHPNKIPVNRSKSVALGGVHSVTDVAPNVEVRRALGY